jgi:DNA-directed RNA polymerase subunit M/transcription elongation factor TFIIS
MLPKLDVPIYNIKLISTGQDIRIRPFLVKEQKLFLMASETEDSKETINTIRQVLKNCILDEVDVDNLPTFDLEYLFMNLRARSVEEVVNLKYKCNNNIKNDKDEETVCNGSVEFDVNLLEVIPTTHAEHTNKFQLTEKIGICLKYPTFEMIQKYEGMDENDIMVNILVDCIEYLFDSEQIYYTKDSTRKELEEFVESMQQKDLEKIKVFFDTMPEIKKDVHFKCPKCGYEEDMVIRGLQNFFA